jgi:predicted nucleic acid-binding protein
MTVFIDTNILVYAHDEDAGERHQKARSLIEHARGENDIPFISIQVLQELISVLIRRGVPPDIIREVIEHYLLWNVVENTCVLMRRALEIQQQFQLSFWDANIVAAAQQSGAKELWTEDLNDGQYYGDVRVMNPFKEG